MTELPDLNHKLQALFDEMAQSGTALSTKSISHFLELLQAAKAGQKTEGANPRHKDIQHWDDRTFVTELIHSNQLPAMATLDSEAEQIADAATAAIERLSRGGRIVYVGAGTSGRLGGLDAMELLPTYDWPENRVVMGMCEPQRFMTGTAKDGAEDKLHLVTLRIDGYPDDARVYENLAEQVPHLKGMAHAPINENDVVICVAASGTTPYTNEFARQARERGALIIGATSNLGAPLLKHADHAIVTQTGWEIPDGSTRMGAGTAQKSILSVLTTSIMRRMPGIHGIHDGYMVNMHKPANIKLVGREKRLVATLAGVTPEQAEAALKAVYEQVPECTSYIKEGILVARSDGRTSPAAAHALLTKHERHLGNAMQAQDRWLEADAPEQSGLEQSGPDRTGADRTGADRFKKGPILPAAERNAGGEGRGR